MRPPNKETVHLIRAISRCSNKDGSFSPGGSLKKALVDKGIITTKESRAAMIKKAESMTNMRFK